MADNVKHCRRGESCSGGDYIIVASGRWIVEDAVIVVEVDVR